MDYGLMMKSLGVLALIVALILLVAKAMKSHFIKEKFTLYGKDSSYLKIMERQTIDINRSLIQFQDQHHTYLVLLGQQSEHVLHKQARVAENISDF